MLKYTLMLLGSRLVRVLPLWFAYWLASCFAYLAYIFIPARRKLLGDNIALASGSNERVAIARMVKSAYRHSARNTVDFLLFPSLSPKRIREMGHLEGGEHLDAALSQGKGAVVVTAHLGHWEFGGALLSSLGYEIVVITESIAPKRKLAKEERIASLFREFREKTGMAVIPMEKLMMPAVRALRNGKVLVFVADRDITGQGVEVSFLGRRCRLPRGPAFFSLRMGSPIVTGCIVRNRTGIYSGIIQEPIEPGDARCDRAGIHKLTQKIATELEKMISAYPDQWFVFERLGETKDP